MIDSLPDIYYLESIEQMRALADGLRQRIVQVLTVQPLTVTQLGAELDLSPARVHYHVRELERVGLVRLVATREKGGILEKYYRSVARSLTVPASLLQQGDATPLSLVAGLLDEVGRDFLAVTGQVARGETEALDLVGLSREHLWMTPEEVTEVQRGIADLLAPYVRRRYLPDERAVTVVYLSHPTRAEEAAGTARLVTVGATQLDRAQLEGALARGERLAVTVIGYCRVPPEVPAELVDRAIERFHLVGRLSAAPEVRAVLRRKDVTE